jgi:hypothetical protein
MIAIIAATGIQTLSGPSSPWFRPKSATSIVAITGRRWSGDGAMIVSDRHRFIFVHIPKCAGTSVRGALEPYDDSGGRFDQHVSEDPSFGRLDFTHLPLDLLAAIFPDDYAKFSAYASFCVVRDPFQRFPSAVAQHVKMYRGTLLASLDRREIAREIDDAIAHLRRVERVTDPEHIHLAPQTDFVFRDGVQVVRSVFPLERLDRLADTISAYLGHQVGPFGRQNQAMVFKQPALRPLMMAGSTLAKRLLPDALSAMLRAKARKIWLQAGEGSIDDAFAAEHVRAFIAEYYRDDIVLHRRALSDSG